MTQERVLPLLSVRDLRVGFRVGEDALFDAVKGISFDVPGNKTIALVGESGSGKSVTAMAILRLLPDNAQVRGQILYRGDDVLAYSQQQMRTLRGSDISVVFQDPMSSLNPVFTIGAQVSEVLAVHTGLSPVARRQRVLELLEEVGIPDPGLRQHSFPHELSGGQQQRVMIAVAIACNPKLLIADEPTTALDVTIQRQILDLLHSLRKRHAMSVLFITHDLGVVGEVADDVIVMRHGEIQESGPVRAIFEHPQMPYTQALLQCRPRLDRRPLRLPVVADFMNGTAPTIASGGRHPRLDGALVLEVKNLGKTFELKQGLFRTRAVRAVHDVSFKLRRARTLGLVGESGSGKTTVGMALMRLHAASTGQVLFHQGNEAVDLLALSEKQMMPYRRRIQIVFQNPYASLNPRFSVRQILTEPMRIHGLGDDESARVQEAAALLDRVGLPATALHKYPHEFSGGQRQRIAIARCLTMKPDVLICDESVSALDVSVQAQVLNLLLDLQDEFGLAYIFISHDLSVVKYVADEVMVMNRGEVVETADADQIYDAPQNEYTRRLLSAIPKGLAQTG